MRMHAPVDDTSVLYCKTAGENPRGRDHAGCREVSRCNRAARGREKRRKD